MKKKTNKSEVNPNGNSIGEKKKSHRSWHAPDLYSVPKMSPRCPQDVPKMSPSHQTREIKGEKKREREGERGREREGGGETAGQKCPYHSARAQTAPNPHKQSGQTRPTALPNSTDKPPVGGQKRRLRMILERSD